MKKSLVLAALLGAGALVGALLRFECTAPEKTCVLCHEIRGSKETWARRAHKDVNCKACHGGTVEGAGDNVRRVWTHVFRRSHPKLGTEMCLGEAQVAEMTDRCIVCHQAEGAQWKRSGHARPVETFLTNTVHNAAWKPADSCLRCHGMFLEGGFDRILAREKLSTVWTFRDPAQGKRAAVPCLACHSMHGTDSLAFYSRPENRSFPAAGLFLQALVQPDGTPVRRGTDGSTRLCAQCHAANAEGIAGSSDDTSPVCRPEGRNCTDCHKGHGFEVNGNLRTKSKGERK